MSSRHQKEVLRRRIISGEVPIPPGRFERIDLAHRVRCVLCRATGYGEVYPQTGWALSPWQVDHVLDHPSACRCGLTFLSPGHLAQHVKADRWPDRAREHGAT